MEKQQLKTTNLTWVGELAISIVRQSVEDYFDLNKKLNRVVKRLKKEKKLAGTTKIKNRRLKGKIRRLRRDIRNIIIFINSEWYIFLTNISQTKMLEILRNAYINEWKMKNKSYGYLYLQRKFIKKGV